MRHVRGNFVKNTVMNQNDRVVARHNCALRFGNFIRRRIANDMASKA